MTSGGVANLASDSSFDLAANAETQGLKQYAGHKNIRTLTSWPPIHLIDKHLGLIYIICEVAYRIVANKASGITTLADLKGKKIGTMSGTSAGVFVSRMLATAGVQDGQYTVVSGNVCMKTPCGSNTLPGMLQSKQIDAFGIWEPAVELGIRAIGEANAVVFQNASVYREVYSLYSTTDKLNDAAKRKDIVAFVRGLNQTLDLFQPGKVTDDIYKYVAGQVGMDAEVVKAVWGDHKWSGRWGDDLMPLLVEEDAYLAKQDRRTAMSKADLEKFLDDSVIAEI